MIDTVGIEFPTRWSLPISLFMYAFGLIVLINLLIAAMTETYQRLREKSTLYYLYARSSLIEEFKRKGALPPPLNLFSILFYDVPLMAEWMMRTWCGSWRSSSIRYASQCLHHWTHQMRSESPLSSTPGGGHRSPQTGCDPSERQELKQEGQLHARPLKVRAPSERQKRKPGKVAGGGARLAAAGAHAAMASTKAGGGGEGAARSAAALRAGHQVQAQAAANPREPGSAASAPGQAAAQIL